MRRSYPTKITPYGPGSGGLWRSRRGHLFIRHIYYTVLCCICLPIVVIFCEESSAKYRAWRLMWSGLRN
jgi:hypothetical protein